MDKGENGEFDDEFLEGDDTVIDDGPARVGYHWVNAGTHEIVGDGNGPKPDVPGKIVCRRYFDDFESGLHAFGEFGTNSQRLDEVKDYVREVGEKLGLPFRECFFLVDEGHSRTREYIAFVYGNRRGGSAWAKKTQFHTSQQVKRGHPGNGKLAHLNVVHFVGSLSAARPKCPVTEYVVPLSGKCDCGSPKCPYSGVK